MTDQRKFTVEPVFENPTQVSSIQIVDHGGNGRRGARVDIPVDLIPNLIAKLGTFPNLQMTDNFDRNLATHE